MKKIKTLIAAAVLGLGVTVSSISPAAVSMQTAEAATVKQGLVKVKNKYYYYNAKGKKVKNKWVTVKVKGKKQKYYFNKKGAALTVPARLVCGGLKWDTGTKQYLAAPAAADLVINHSGQILSTEDTQVAVFYLTPCSPADLLTDLTGTGGTPGLTLTADVAKDINFTTGARNASFPILDGNLNFMDQFGSPATQLKGGESYETTLKFDIDSFTLEGEEKEWEDGGKMTVPVVVPEPTPGP